MKPTFVFLFLFLALFATEITACTHILDITNNQCYISNTTLTTLNTTAVSCLDFSFPSFSLLSSASSSASSLSSLSSLTLASSTKECGVFSSFSPSSSEEDFSNSIHFTQPGVYLLIGGEQNEKNESQTTNLIFSSLESPSIIELVINSSLSESQLPTIRMLNGQLILKTNSCALIQPFVHCGTQNSSSEKVTSTNWNKRFDEETCTLFCHPLSSSSLPSESDSNSSSSNSNYIIKKQNCTKIISGVLTWGAFSTIVYSSVNNSVLCLNVSSITKSFGNLISTPDPLVITIMSLYEGGTAIIGGTFETGLFYGGSPIPFSNSATFVGINFVNFTQTLTNQGVFQFWGPATFINCKFINISNIAEIYLTGVIISSWGSPLTLINCEFTSNTGNYGRGLIYSDGGLTMINCTFTNNTVFSNGMILVSYTNVLITGCTFSGSSSIEDTASVIYIVFAEESYHNVTISKSRFINNRLPRGATNGAVIYVFQRSPCSNHLAIASLTFDNPDTPHELTIVGNGLITFTPFNTCITPNVMTSPAAGSFTFITNSLGNVISSFCSTCALVYGGVSGYCDSMSKTINCANIASSTEPKVKCVSDCPTPLFNTGTSCEPACPIPSYVTLETRVCGDSFDCLIPNPSNRFCVKCEPNTYYNNESSTCVPASKCPVTAPLADAATGSCVAANECSVYTTFVKDNVCYSCPPLTYNNNGVCTPCSTDVLCTKCYTSVANWTSLTDILSNSVPQDVLCFRLSSPVTKPSSAPSFTIPRSLTIAHLSVQGDGVISSNRAFNTPFSSRVNWVDVTFQNFIVSGCNGAVHSITAGTTTFTNCRFLNISSSSLAGSIVAQSFATVVNFNKCTFSNNTSEEGGAVLVYQATSRFTDCVFSKNRAGRGGAVALEDGNNWFKNCSFINNSCSASSSCGGAVFVKTYNALPEYNNAFVRSTFSGNYCQKPVITSSVFSVVSPTTKILNLGLASVDFGGALNPIYVSMTGVGSVLNIYSFNTCWFQLYQRDKGVVNSYAAGTNATAGINNFCSTCINVFPNKEYCNLLSSTIDCMDAIISTEPTGTQCACPADFVNDNTTMTCVPQKKGNGDGSSDGSNNNVIGGGSNSENSSSGSSGNVNMASIYGPVVGIILVIAVVGIVIFRRRRRTQLESFDNLESNESHSVGLFKLPTSDSSSLSSNPELYSQLEMPKIKANEIRDIGKML